jgi:hypothetical protein
MTPCIVIIKDGVVDDLILCRDGDHAKTVFVEKCAETFSNWEEYSQADIDAIIDNGYEQSAHSAVCLSWARTPDEEIG